MSGTADELDAAIKAFENDMQKIRTSGASASLLDDIKVNLFHFPHLSPFPLSCSESNRCKRRCCLS